MIRVFVGNKGTKRVVEVRVVRLSDTKSKSFSISVEEDAKEKDYDIEKIRDLLNRLLDEYVRKEGGLII